MKFKPFLLIYLGLIYCNCADLKLTVDNVLLPTKIKTKKIDNQEYDKVVVNESASLTMTFKFGAKNNLQEKTTDFYFNDCLIKFGERKDIVLRNGEVEKATKLFHLDFPKLSDKIVGNYTLKIVTNDGQEINATGKILSPPFLQEFQESKRKVEGGKLEVTCKCTSNPEITNLMWTAVSRSKNNFRKSLSSNSSKFEDLIIWDLLVREDAGYYKCNATNIYGNDTIILQVRVKDKLAPLWPFIGIILEIIILIIIVVVYERQRRQTKTAETNNNPVSQSLLESRKTDENEEVRHRKPVA